MRDKDRIHPENHGAYPALSDELEHVADKLERDPTMAKKKYGDFICDIASKAQHYKMTEAQAKAASKALKSRHEMEDVPDTGDRRVGISGEVLSLKTKRGYDGRGQLKMLLKTRMVDGRDVTCKLYGSVPSVLADRVAEGAKVSFTASIDKSGDDPKFGFFSNPRDAEFKRDRLEIENREDADVTSASGLIEDVRDTAGKCGHLAFSPDGDELICVGSHTRTSGEPHEYLPFDDVKKLLESADDATDVSLSHVQPFKEADRDYPAEACAWCGPDGMAQPEHIFDALGNPPWEYDPSAEAIHCGCCGEPVDHKGPGPVDVRCDGKCSGAGKKSHSIKGPPF